MRCDKEKPQLRKCKNAGNSGRSVNWHKYSRKRIMTVTKIREKKTTPQHNDCVSKWAHPPLHICHSNSPDASIPAHYRHLPWSQLLSSDAQITSLVKEKQRTLHCARTCLICKTLCSWTVCPSILFGWSNGWHRDDLNQAAHQLKKFRI